MLDYHEPQDSHTATVYFSLSKLNLVVLSNFLVNIKQDRWRNGVDKEIRKLVERGREWLLVPHVPEGTVARFHFPVQHTGLPVVLSRAVIAPTPSYSQSTSVLPDSQSNSSINEQTAHQDC